MDIKYIILPLMLLLPNIASAKLEPTTRTRLLHEAGREFESGNYDEARKIYYDIYVEDGDQKSEEFLGKCKECAEILSKAYMDERNGLYSDAMEKYRLILTINPLDSQIPSLIKASNAKLHAPLLQESKDLFKEGKYAEAQEKLSEYSSKTDMVDDELTNSINHCIELIGKAEQATQQKKYADAIDCYNKILEINPSDVISTRAIAKLERQNQRTIKASASSTLVVKTKVNRNSYCR